MRQSSFLSIIVLLFSIFATSTNAEYHGRFIGDVSGTFLDEIDSRPRLRLDHDFAFEDPNGLMWSVPKGTVVDGASIPQFLWLIASPFAGDYLWASVIHDYYCDTKVRTSHDTHRNFFYGMLAKGVDRWMADGMYWAVATFGPRWEISGPSPNLSDPVLLAAARAKAAAVFQTLQWSDGKYLDSMSDGKLVPATADAIEESAAYYRAELVTGRFLTEPQRMGVVGLWGKQIVGSTGFNPELATSIRALVSADSPAASTAVTVTTSTPEAAMRDWLQIEQWASGRGR